MPNTTIRVRQSDLAPNTVSVTAAAGSSGTRIDYPASTDYFSIVNTDTAYGVEYRFGSSQWAYLGKGVGAEFEGNINTGLYVRLVNDGATQVAVEVSGKSSEGGVKPAALFGALGYVGRPTRRTQLILGDSIAARGTHLPHTPANRAVRQTFSSMGALNANGQFISLAEFDFGTTSGGNGTFRYEFATKKLYWTAPGDTEGVGVVITTAACMYTLQSGTPGKAAYLGMIPSKAPSADASVTIQISGAAAVVKSNVSSTGILSMTNALLGCPYAKSYAYAIPGIAAVDWLAASAQWESLYTDDTDILLGTNDLNNRASMLAGVDAIEQIIQKRLAIGSRVTLSGIFPYDSRTALQRQIAAEMSILLHKLADKYNIVMCDGWGLAADPLTGNYMTGGSADALHPSSLSAVRIAPLWLDAKRDLVMNSNSNQSAIPLYDATDAPYGNLLPNGALTGTAGTLGTRATGTVPNNYVLEATTGSVLKVNGIAPASAGAVPRFNGGSGNCFAIEFDNTGGVNGESANLRLGAFLANYSPGDKIQLELQLAVSGTGITTVGAYISSQAQITYALFFDTTANAGLFDIAGKQLIFPVRSEPMIIEEGTTNITMSVFVACQAGGVGTMLIDPSIVIHKVP